MATAISYEPNVTDEGNLLGSRNAYRRIYPVMAEALLRSEPCAITVVNGWRQ